MNIYPADYRTSQNPKFVNNPLIECLEGTMDYVDFFKKVHSTRPESRKDALKFDPIRREEFLSLLKGSFFVPSNRLYQLYKNINTTLFASYHLRNPLTKNKVVEISYRDIQSAINTFEPTNSLSFSLIGVSGVGKTTAINRILSLYPKGISHSKIDCDYFVQVPFVKIECPKDSSIKDLCTYFFNDLDKTLGTTTYSKIFGGNRATGQSMVIAMSKLVDSHKVGMLIVDEIQHLANAKSGGGENVLNFFINLSNTLKVPILIVGTPESADLFKKNLRLPRRWSSEGADKWDRVPFDEEWFSIVAHLFKYQYTENEVTLTQDWIEFLYSKSQGIIDRLVRIFVEAQKRVFALEQSQISKGIIEAIIKEKFFLEEGAIEAIRRQDKKELSRNYRDVWIDEPGVIEKEDYKLLNITQMLNDFGIPENFYHSRVRSALSENPTFTTEKIVLMMFSEYKEFIKSKPEKLKSVQLEKNYSNGDLRNLYDENMEKRYENLVRESIVMDITKEYVKRIP